jgi:hypothetical protein
MQTLKTLARVLPLCCGFFLMAAQDDCTIRIVTDDGDECEDVDEVCNLDCELATNDDGCPICACAGEGEGEGEGEGAGECLSDADCRDGQFCALEESCPPCVNGDPACDVACTLKGTCVDIQPDPCAAVLCAPDTICLVDENGNPQCIPVNDGCRSDDECGPNAFCDFSLCGQRPDGSNGGGSDAPIAPCDVGFCHEIDPGSCANVFCGPGSICVETDVGPQCVPSNDGCQADSDCGPNAHCEQVCSPDPNCPMCDVCFLQGICVDDGCPALCGPGSQCVIHDDGSVGCEPIVPPTPECTSDDQCANGAVCNAADVCLPNPACGPNSSGLVVCTDECWGYCVPPEPASCTDDSQCAQGEYCEVTTTCPACGDPNTDPACLAPCFIEGKCLPR